MAAEKRRGDARGLVGRILESIDAVNLGQREIDRLVGAKRWVQNLKSRHEDGGAMSPDPLLVWRYATRAGVSLRWLFERDGQMFAERENEKISSPAETVSSPRTFKARGRSAVKFEEWAARSGRVATDIRAVIAVQEILGDADPELSGDACEELWALARALHRAADSAVELASRVPRAASPPASAAPRRVSGRIARSARPKRKAT